MRHLVLAALLSLAASVGAADAFVKEGQGEIGPGCATTGLSISSMTDADIIARLSTPLSRHIPVFR